MSNNTNKLSNIFIDIAEAKVITDVKSAGKGDNCRVACYAGGGGANKQELYLTLFLPANCGLTKGDRIAVKGDYKLLAPSPGYEAKGPSQVVFVENFDDFKKLEPLPARVAAPAKTKAATEDQLPF